MSRIRSIHPGLFTDEAYMCLSLAGKAILPGIWIEADDNGIFEWKPMTLKARIMPCENIDMAAILAEYEAAGIIRRFEADGRPYGAIHNFRKFQRPEKPKAWHPLPDDLVEFVGLSPISHPSSDKKHPEISTTSTTTPQPFADHSPTTPRKSGQMEEEGGKREEGEEIAVVGAGDPERDPIRVAMESIGAWDDPNCRVSGGRVLEWIRAGSDLELDILPTMASVVTKKRSTDGPNWLPTSMSYFDKPIAKATANRTKPIFSGGPDEPRNHSHRQSGAGRGSAHEALFAGGAAVAARFQDEDGNRG